MNTIIFSKNRPYQLEGLLRSLKKNLEAWDHNHMTVIWKAEEGTSFEYGYEQCQGLYPNVIWRRQDYDGKFKDLTLAAIDPKQEFTMFLVDDIIFKDKFSVKDKEFALLREEDSALCLSLRLYPGITYCYPTHQTVRVPALSADGLWQWSGCDGDWGYPLSVDGHIFKTALIRQIAEQLSYESPNSFEGAMANIANQLAHRFSHMICYTNNSKLLNIPANRVQDEVQNRVGNSLFYDPSVLAEAFNQGSRLDIDVFQGHKNTAPHEEQPYSNITSKEVQ